MRVLNENINLLQLGTEDYFAQKTLLTDKFWDWLTQIEENYGIISGSTIHIKWTCEVEENSILENDETAKIQEELEELKRQKKLLEEGKLFLDRGEIFESPFKINIPIDDDELEFGPETARLLNLNKNQQLNYDEEPILSPISESDRMTQLDEALETAAELFKELGLDMGELDAMETLDEDLDNILKGGNESGELETKKEWPPKPKKKQWPPKPVSRPSKRTLPTEKKEAPKKSPSKSTEEKIASTRNYEDEPWTCYTCNTHNTKGKFCHLCSVEILPPGFPPPLYPKQLKFPGGDEIAYKEWMRKKVKVEDWENSLKLYRKHFKEGNGQECLKIIKRIKEEQLCSPIGKTKKTTQSKPIQPTFKQKEQSNAKDELGEIPLMPKLPELPSAREPWKCHQCSQENKMGTMCSRCKVEKLPAGFPLPPRHDREKLEFWSESLRVYRLKEAAGDTHSCSQILTRVKELSGLQEGHIVVETVIKLKTSGNKKGKSQGSEESTSSQSEVIPQIDEENGWPKKTATHSVLENEKKRREKSSSIGQARIKKTH